MNILVVVIGGSACAADVVDSDAASSHAQQAVIYGTDDRHEYYRAGDEAAQALFDHTAAIMRFTAAEAILDGDIKALGTLQERANLCPQERFAEQPAAAFCSGVLVAPDLVLTAAHCMDAFPLEETRVVFGYYYETPNALAVGEQDIYRISEVVARSDDHDFAWLRLEGAVPPNRSPASRSTRRQAVEEGQRLFSVTSPAGVPLKGGDGVVTRDTEASASQFFFAHTDTFRASSGGGVFNEDSAMLGILVSGQNDFEDSDAGCARSVRLEEYDRSVGERFLFASVAVAGLCRATHSSLCESECDQNCTAQQDRVTGGCGVGPHPATAAVSSTGAFLLCMLLAAWRPGGRRPIASNSGERDEV